MSIDRPRHCAPRRRVSAAPVATGRLSGHHEPAGRNTPPRRPAHSCNCAPGPGGTGTHSYGCDGLVVDVDGCALPARNRSDPARGREPSRRAPLVPGRKATTPSSTLVSLLRLRPRSDRSNTRAWPQTRTTETKTEPVPLSCSRMGGLRIPEERDVVGSWQDLNMTEIPARLSIVTLGVREMDVLRSSTGRWAGPSCPTVTTPGPAFSSGVSCWRSSR